MQAGVFGGTGFGIGSLRMFTTLSNIFIFLYFLVDFIYLLVKKTDKDIYPIVKFSAVVSITLTGLVALILLGGMMKGLGGTLKIAIILLHDVVPILAVLDYILFTKGFNSKYKMVPYALIFPLFYCILAMILGTYTAFFGAVGEYPYPFMDVNTLGIGMVLLTILIISVLLTLYSFLLLFLNNKLNKIE